MWTNWKSEDAGGGIKVNGAPAVCSWKEGRLDVFIRSTDNRLFHRVYENEAWQGAWRDILDGQRIETSPAAVSWGPDRIDLFVVSDKRTYHRACQGGAWGPWENLGGTTNDAPAAASWKNGRVDVLVRGTNNLLYRRYWEAGVTSGWKEWEMVGGSARVMLSAPVAVATTPYRIDCFARGSNEGHLIHTAYEKDRMENWEELDNLTFRDAPGIASGPTAQRGRVDVVVRGTNDVLYHRVYYTALEPGGITAIGGSVGGWEVNSAWDPLSVNQIRSAPAALAWWSGNVPKRIDCFAQDPNNNLMHTWWK